MAEPMVVLWAGLRAAKMVVEKVEQWVVVRAVLMVALTVAN